MFVYKYLAAFVSSAAARCRRLVFYILADSTDYIFLMTFLVSYMFADPFTWADHG